MAKRGQSIRNARAVRRPAKPPVDLKLKIAGLERELEQALERQAATSDENMRLSAELDEAVHQQTATADVLKVVSRSASNLQPVFDAIAENAVSLCQAERAFIFRFDGERLRAVAYYNVGRDLKEFVDRNPIAPGRQSISARAALERRTIHVHDVQADPEYAYAVRDADLIRTILAVPMLKGDELIGTITIYRLVTKPFTDKQVTLVETFADQAMIAIENARLLTEQREALEQQTATAEVLQVINSSPGELAPVFTAMLEKATRLCGAGFGILWLYDGEQFRAAAAHAVPPAFAEFCGGPLSMAGSASLKELAQGGGVVHVPDLAASDLYRAGNSIRRAVVDLGGGRSLLSIPLRKDGTLLGAFTIYRKEVRPFSDKEIGLVQNFAVQAVIAMENARLITETREALEQQTATAEVLGVINASPGDLGPVFDAMLEKALRLCDAAIGGLGTWQENRFRFVASRGPQPLTDYIARNDVSLGSREGFARVSRGEGFMQFTDISTSKFYESGEPYTRALVDRCGARTTLTVPLAKDDAVLGVLAFFRQEVKPFSDKQIALVKSFATQAVIAMENARLITETREALERQTATAEVLQVINSSPGNLAPVFEAMLDKALGLCEAAFGILWIYDGERIHAAALRGVPQAHAEFLTRTSHPVGSDNAHGRLLGGEAVVHIADVADSAAYRSGDPIRRNLVEAGGGRTLLAVPLRKGETFLGDFVIYRQEVKPFSDRQIALLQNFAAQAVIAIENARLITETREALEQQTATAEVLQVINSSPGDLAPVFDAILEKAHSLCTVAHGSLQLYDGEKFRVVATHGLYGALPDGMRQAYIPGPNHPMRQLLEGARFVQISNWGEIDDPRARALYERGLRTTLLIPLRKDNRLLGHIGASRLEVRPFTEKEIALLENFAAQAVIAMENARLLDEVRHRADELAEALEFQTATGEVLRIVASSPDHLQSVFDAMLTKATELCEATFGTLFLYDGKRFTVAADRNLPSAYAGVVRGESFSPETNTGFRRLVESKAPVHVKDVLADGAYIERQPMRVAAVDLGGVRSFLAVPMLKKGELIGNFSIYRDEPGGFAENQIALVTTFADQAVVAIENARLFEELRERQAELRVTFDNMGDGVVMFDAESRLTAWNRNFQEMLELPDTFLAGRPSHADYFRYLADRGEYVSADLEEQLSRTVDDTRRELRFERTRPDGRVIEVRRNAVPGGGFVMIYSDVTERKRAEEAIRVARDAAETALRELQTAQASLVHAQKMAALGQLTAGIAHEIKNPLNFVNNFAGLSVELLDELKQATEKVIGTLDADERAAVVDTIGMLTGNLEKIAEHGRRADGIVKSMLQHSRGGSGEWQASDLNALVEEALNLAYHGARAQDQSFNITIEREFDQTLAPIDVVPQDMMRVFLNLIGNGFYAANKRRRDQDGAFRPVLKVMTRDFGDAIEIRVRDNGVGIPNEHRERLFQPFFTTKPTGEGTGLGLSISYEIATQQHGGTITVDSQVGQFTEFTVRLPRRPATGRVA